MTNTVLDAVSAWGELGRFAEMAGVELDERAHPDYTPADDVEDEDEPPKDESDISDYDDLLRALRSGHLTVDQSGALNLYWKKPPHKDRPVMTIDPEGADEGKGWPYGVAYRALHTVPAAPAVSKAARKRTPSTQEDDRLGRMDRFLEILAGESPGTMMKLRHRLDRALVVSLANFILLE